MLSGKKSTGGNNACNASSVGLFNRHRLPFHSSNRVYIFAVNQIQQFMRSSFFAVFAAVILVSITSCKKEKGRDYSQLTQLQQSVTLPYIDSAKALALYNIVATERASFLNRLEADYPGLKDQMEYDLQQIAATDDSATRELLIEDFVTSYYNQVKQTWNNSGLNIASLTSKYAQVLGNIPFTVGEFGQIITEQQASVAEYNSPFPDDSVTVFTGTPVFETENNCLGAVGSTNRHNQIQNQVRVFTSAVGGCWISNTGGASITIPSTSRYAHIHARFQIDASHMDCIAGAFAGASVASSKLTVFGEKYISSEVFVERDIYACSVVAPVIWYARARHEFPSTEPFEISLPAANPYYAGEYRVYMRTENAVSTGALISGSHSETDLSKYRTTVRMIK